jgi:hypothetical protein
MKTTFMILLLGLFAVPSLATAASAAVVTAPEPATGALIVTGIGAGIAALRRRRRR